MNNLDLIEKYLSEELSGAEQAQFDQLRSSDKDFAEEVQMAVVINADFKVKQKLRWQGLLEGQATTAQETPVRQLTPRKSSLGWIRNIAAVFILGMGLALAWMVFTPADLNQLADDHLVSVYQAPMATMTETDLEANWQNAIGAYQEGQFSQAVVAIENSIQVSDDRIDEKHFYLGLSYLYEEVPNLDKAISHLEQSKKLNAQRFAPQANWFMSLAYLKKGNQESAEVLLQELVSANDWKKAEATALLNNL